MPIMVSWDNTRHTIVLIEFIPPWDWSDFETAMLEAFTLIRNVPHRVDMICDSPDDMTLPFGNTFEHFRRVVPYMPDNLGIVLGIGGDKFTRQVATAFARSVRTLSAKVALVATLAEAREILTVED